MGHRSAQLCHPYTSSMTDTTLRVLLRLMPRLQTTCLLHAGKFSWPHTAIVAAVFSCGVVSWEFCDWLSIQSLVWPRHGSCDSIWHTAPYSCIV